MLRGMTLLTAFLLILNAGWAIAAGEQGVMRSVLDNGLRVIIIRNSLAPVATVQINYLAGANESPAGFPGTAHALEHMMFRGNPGLSADQLATIMAALGGDSNANTQQTVTQYYITTPVEELDTVIRVEAIRMRGVLATQEAWEKERGAIEQEVARDISEPMYIFHTRLQAKMLAGTPYAVDGLGNKPSFDRTTGLMLERFHEQWYGPNNAILVIVGDVDPDQTLSMVQRYFGNIPSRPTPKRPEGELAPLTGEKLDMETDMPYGLALIAYRLPGYASSDYAAGRVLADVLDSQRARLYELVPEGRALSAGFSTEEFAPASIGYAVAAYPTGPDGESLVRRLKAIIEDYRDKGVPAELVEAAKAQEIAAACFNRNSIYGLAVAWSQAVAVEGRTSPDDDIEAIRSVTVNDVNRVARRYLLGETAVTAVLSPREGGKPKSVTGSKAREAFAPSEVKPVKLPDWAGTIGELKIPESIPAPQEFWLDNGLRLLVVPSEVSPTVSLFGAVRTRPEMQQPVGKEGVADVLSELFSYGTTTLDRIAYRRAMDAIAATSKVGSEFSLLTVDDKFEQGLALLADNILRPALPASAFAVVRQEQIGALAGEQQSPEYHVRRALLTSLFPADDPTNRETTRESLESLSLDDVWAYYHKVFRPDMTTIVVIGHIDPEKAYRVITQEFGAWQSVGPKPDINLPPVPLSKSSTQIVSNPDRVQDEVTLAQAGDVIRSSADYYRLQIGMNVLAGGFYATRFYRDLREKTGLVYTVDGQFEAGPTRSLLTVSYGCNPENVGNARDIIVGDLRAMQQNEVSADELRQAKMLLLRRIPLLRASVEGTAAMYLELVRNNLSLDEPQQAARRIVDVTAEEIRDAFARRIRPDELVQIIQGPTP